MKKSKIFLLLTLVMVFSNFMIGDCLAESVKIHRDNYGVPHIYSDTVDGLYYGWGYATAQDRLFQLEMTKRVYYGQVSEIFGEDYYDTDLFWRNEFPTSEELVVQFKGMDQKYQDMITAYTNGINAWIKKVLDNKDKLMPYEYHELGIEPDYWTELDVAAAVMANYGLFMHKNNELWHLDVYNHLKDKYGDKADDYFHDLAWFHDPDGYTTIKKGDVSEEVKLTPPESYEGAQLDRLDSSLAQAKMFYPDKAKMIAKSLTARGLNVPQKIKGKAIESMSYCVVANGEKSETGRPVLMAGPQVEHWFPSMLHEVGLHGPGYDVVGTAMTGGPFIMFGANKTAAFSCTAGGDNVIDMFEEKLNPENPMQYKFKGEWRDIEVRTEKIWVKGEKEPRLKKMYRTVHGPVVAFKDTDNDGKNDVAYSKMVAAFNEYMTMVPAYTELMLADTPNKFVEASKKLMPVLNFFYADNKGNIGYFHAGKLPIRAEGIDTRFPTPGTGEYEWRGFVAPEDHPYIINPSSNLIVNWNNKPIDNFPNGDMTSIFTWGCWSVDQRVFTLDREVRKRLPIDTEDLKDIIHEIADADLKANAMKDYLLEALEDVEDPELVKAREILASWNNKRKDLDNDGYTDSPAEAIFKDWWYNVNKNAFSDELSPFWDGLYDYGGLLYNYGGYSFFKRTVMGDEAAVPVRADWYNGQGWKTVFVESLEETIDHLTKKYGTSDMEKWLKKNKKGYFLPSHLAGAPTSLVDPITVKYMDRGSENHIVDCTWPTVTAEDIVPPGQSGFINKDGVKDKHFDDQLDMFLNWEYKPMLLKKGEILIDTESTEIIIFDSEELIPNI